MRRFRTGGFDRKGRLSVIRKAVGQAERRVGVMPDDHVRTLAWLMEGSGDPANVRDVVQFWLSTPTWQESFDVLAAGREVLVTQAGLDALQEFADDDAMSVHAAILQAVVGGLDLQFVQTVVTHRAAARKVSAQALRNGHNPILRVVLALNTALGASDEGAAMYLAGEAAAGHIEEMRSSCQAAVDSDPRGARRVAEQLDVLRAEGLAGDEVLVLLEVLRSG